MSNQKVLELRISEIEEIIENLQLEHKTLGNQLEGLKVEIKEVARDCEDLKTKKGQTPNEREIKLTLEGFRRHIGRKAKILNPKKGESNFGVITKVGSLYISIELPSGQRRKRVASNVRLIEDNGSARR